MPPPPTVPDYSHMSPDIKMSHCIMDTVNEIIHRYNKMIQAKQIHTIDIRVIKNSYARKYNLSVTPKLIDIISAVPDTYKKQLQPYLCAKPIRSASGISVVAVMCKPHRCPHIAMTGNICVYCFTPDHQLLTSTGFKFVDTLTYDDLIATYNDTTQQIEYHKSQQIIVKPGTHTIVDMMNSQERSNWDHNDNYSQHRTSVDTIITKSHNNHIALSVTNDHDMYVKQGTFNTSTNSHNYSDWSIVKAQQLVTTNTRANTRFMCSAVNGIHIPTGVHPMINKIRLILSLNNDDAWYAFVELYGYWLGNGSLALPNQQRIPGVQFHTVNDTEYIISLLERIQLISGIDYTVTGTYQVRVTIYNKVWVQWLSDEYSKKYAAGVYIKSMKRYGIWCWQLSQAEIVYLLTGLTKADGHIATGADGRPVDGGGEIYTSSVSFRDQTVQLCLHAGYSVYFIVKYKKGGVRSPIRNVKKPRVVPISTRVANADRWCVVYSKHIQAAQPVLHNHLEITTRQYTGTVYCVNVVNHKVIARKAHTDDNGIVTKASKPTIVGNCPGGPDSDFEYSTQAYTGYEPTCLTADHQVLTSSGWRDISTVQVGATVMTINPDNLEIQWQPVLEAHQYEYTGTLYRLYSDKMDAVCTSNHRWATMSCMSSSKKLVFDTVDEILQKYKFTDRVHGDHAAYSVNRNRMLPLSGININPLYHWSLPFLPDNMSVQQNLSWCRLIGFVLGDGGITLDMSGYVPGTEKRVVIHQKNLAGQQYLIEIINNLGIACSICTQADGVARYTFYNSGMYDFFELMMIGPESFIPDVDPDVAYGMSNGDYYRLKRWIYYSWKYQLSVSQSRALIEGWVAADGDWKSIGTDYLVGYTSSIPLRDDMSILGAMANAAVYIGIKAPQDTLSTLHGRTHIKPVHCWFVSFKYNKHATLPVQTASLPKPTPYQPTAYNGMVYSLSVANTTYYARRKDSNSDRSTAAVKSFFTGNSMRAIRSRYDPYRQTRDRIEQLQRLGHDTDKVEFIVMGGTFMSLDIEYRDYFIRNLHDALSGHTSQSVQEAIQYSQSSHTKCVALTIETRPDYWYVINILYIIATCN